MRQVCRFVVEAGAIRFFAGSISVFFFIGSETFIEHQNNMYVYIFLIKNQLRYCMMIENSIFH